MRFSNVGLWALLLTLPASAFAKPLDVGLAPLGGSAPKSIRAEATGKLATTLSGLEGIQLLDFSRLGPVLGGQVQASLAQCSDDPCVVAATSKIRTQRIVAGAINVENNTMVLRVRLLKTSTTAPGPLVRISRQLKEGEPLDRVISEVALELFPEQAAKSFGTLIVVGANPGATVFVDGKVAAKVPLEATRIDARPTLNLKPGSHQVRVRASGHYPFESKVDVLLGQTQELQVDLDKNRSWGPLIVGGLGVLAAGTALAVSLSARGLSGEWEQACPLQTNCAAGFTRQRFLDDQRTVDRGRTVSSALFGVGAAAALGAVLWFFLDPGTDPVEAP